MFLYRNTETLKSLTCNETLKSLTCPWPTHKSGIFQFFSCVITRLNCQSTVFILKVSSPRNIKFMMVFRESIIGTLSKPRRRRQRGHGKTIDLIRDLKQTTTATATRTWKNNRFNWQNNSAARAFENFMHFLAVPCKKTTWNHHKLRRLQTETATANYINFHLELNASLIRYAEVEVWRRMRR